MSDFRACNFGKQKSDFRTSRHCNKINRSV